MDQATAGGGASTQTQTSTPYVFSGWQPWYEGIDRAVGTADLAFDVVPPVARKQYVNALRIDLTNEHVSFCTTPAGGLYQTLGKTVTEFLSEEPAVMVAINANFSWYDQSANFSLLGLAVSQGNVVCDPTKPAPRPAPPTTEADVPDQSYVGAMAMLITEGNAVTFQLVTQANPDFQHLNPYTAIAGSPQPMKGGWPPQQQVSGQPILLVENGANQATRQETPAEEIAGRTGVGLSADGQSLYLVTLDGCENTAEQFAYGGGYYDIAQWLIIAGADKGLNLDGGGSTTMACRDSDNDPVLMNVPYGSEGAPGYQRLVGNYFGVVTQPLS
ncbi:hypothetical protein GCM10022419_129590 [Nonomuraea rosea]|uniref:Phosphodiester glycosidase domain-containing protein n=1 Tax=Nonomuraea rosea TaxID=638574 RepID=A0ABP6ZYS4_9ACTN